MMNAAEIVRSAPEDDDFMTLFDLVGLDRARDLRFADLRGVDLSGCDLSGCDFTGANLTDASFLHSRFFRAELFPHGAPALPKGFGAEQPTRFDQAQICRNALREAAYWNEFAKLENWSISSTPSTRHLPDFTTFSDAPFAPELIVLPAGDFWMGSTPEEQARFDLDEEWRAFECPRHLVSIDQPFAIGRYLVTCEEYDVYREVIGTKEQYDPKWGPARSPAINISHEDAEKYCDWLSKKTGAEYRLPSEAEWEYACRAGTNSAYSWGEDWSMASANGNPSSASALDNLDICLTTEVGQYHPNSWGFYDMHGNLLEWCADRWSPSYDLPRSQQPAFHDDEGCSYRVIRGGSWISKPGGLRSASRNRKVPDARCDFIGFRIARTLTP